jgi:hypothetical protein
MEMPLQIIKQLRLLQGSNHMQRKNINSGSSLTSVFAANPKALKGSKDTTALQSIKGACPNLLGADALHQFMINNKLQNYCRKSKGKMCSSMIIERKKNENLDQIMYGEDFDGGKDDDVDSKDSEEEVTGGDGSTKKKK